MLAVVGVVWLSAGSEATESAPNPIFGNFLEVLAMLCGALYVVCAKQLSSRCSPVLITTMQSLIGLLFFLCLLPLPAVKLPDSFPLLPTLAILYLGVGVTMLSFLLYNFAVRSVPASRTGAFPVSYTHLDVYKRQVPYDPLPASTKACCGFSGHGAASLRWPSC